MWCPKCYARRQTPAVVRWVADRPGSELYFSAVGEAEMRYGVAILPAGRRKNALALAIDAILREDFEDRVLPFDSDAAREYGGDCGCAPCSWPHCGPGRLSDCGNCPLPAAW